MHNFSFSFTERFFQCTRAYKYIVDKSAVSLPWRTNANKMIKFSIFLREKKSIHNFFTACIVCMVYTQKQQNSELSLSLSLWANFYISAIPAFVLLWLLHKFTIDNICISVFSSSSVFLVSTYNTYYYFYLLLFNPCFCPFFSWFDRVFFLQYCKSIKWNKFICFYSYWVKIWKCTLNSKGRMR